MRRMGITGICISAALALSAIGAASASAALPELGRCTAVTPEVVNGRNVFRGEYANKTCTREAPNGHGRYEWAPGPGAKPTFAGSNLKPLTLETVGKKKVVCDSAASEGSYTGPDTETLRFVLKNCEEPGGAKTCQNVVSEEGVPPPGEIITNALKGELGVITGGEKPVVGWDIKPAEGSIVAEYECVKGTVVFLEGSFINQVNKKKVNRMTGEFVLNYKAVGGKQVPESFEGGPKDTLTAKELTLLPPSEKSEQLGWSVDEEVLNEEELEIKTK
jgi:hypothetical protein